MKEHTVQITLPPSLYEPLQQIASATGQPLEEVVLQSIRNGKPPSLRKVPVEFHDDLLALNKMDYAQLWDVIQGKRETPAGLDSLHEMADFPMLRRAYAFSLLKWRGHPIPSPHEMMLD